MIIGCAAGVTGAATQSYLFFTNSLPSVEKLRNYTPWIVTEVYGENGQLIGDFSHERRYVVSIDNIPMILQDAFIAAEDKNFRTHKGVDETAILRAIKDSLLKGKIESGASTITQQVARTFLLTPERKFSRKIREAILAVRIESSMSKEEILYLYLNQIYLGSKAYGVEAASRTYFGKHVKDLTLAEFAMLAGLPQRPHDYSPKVNLKAALVRRVYVLRRMLEDGYITQEQHDQANQEEPRLGSWPRPNNKAAPAFTEHVRRYIEQKYGWDMLMKEGLKVYTTVDLEMTRAGEKAMDQGLRELDKRQGYRGPLKTLNVKGVMEFLEEKTRTRKEPLRFGEITEGVVTKIDDQNVYVRMGSYIGPGVKKEYVGRIKIEPSRDWWVRQPYIRQELRTRNFAQGDLPFQVGDLIVVRLVDPNEMRRDMYLKKYGKTDPELKNYKPYNEQMVDYFPLEVEQDPVVEAALMMRDNRTGYVRALLGSRSVSQADYNRAIQARRQPGSSFKPVIYAAALNKGFTCADIILDSPMALQVPGTGEIWRPRNYRGGFQGPVTFRDAIVKSRNIPTIKILQQIGVEQGKAYALKLGYTSPLANNLTMALGSTGVTVEEQVGAFSTFPNRGYLIPNVYVKRIVDRQGKVLEENPPPILLDDPLQPDQAPIQKVSLEIRASNGPNEPAEKGTRVLKRKIDEGTAYIMCSLLQGVVQDGTATILKKIVGRPDIAGKTGTTNECLDAWFVGFSPDYTCGVWVGFDQESSLGAGETGGKAAAPIWGYFMREALAKVPVKEFPASKAVEFRRINPRTGLATAASDGFQEVFKIGSGPNDVEPGLVKGARWDYSGSDIDQF
jgi:penicillin-binding protein 1A